METWMARIWGKLRNGLNYWTFEGSCFEIDMKSLTLRCSFCHEKYQSNSISIDVEFRQIEI